MLTDHESTQILLFGYHIWVKSIWKYTNPANPVRNFCKQTLRPLPVLFWPTDLLQWISYRKTLAETNNQWNLIRHCHSTSRKASTKPGRSLVLLPASYQRSVVRLLSWKQKPVFLKNLMLSQHPARMFTGSSVKASKGWSNFPYGFLNPFGKRI